MTKIGTALVCPQCHSHFVQTEKKQKYCCRRCALDRENVARNAKYAVDPEFRKQRGNAAAEWKKRNPERARELERRSSQTPERKAKAKLLNAARYKRDKARMYKVSSAYYVRTKAAQPWRMSLFAAKNRAKKKGLPFDLTKEWAEKRWTGMCEATGLPFVSGLGNAGLFSASIDRKDSNKGYTPENCWFVLWSVNSWKTNGKWDDIVLIAKAIAERF